MTNKEIYMRTIGFSLRRWLYDALAFIVLAVACTVGFIITDKLTGNGLIGLCGVLVVGLIALYIFLRYVAYTYKAGQIAMMTYGITKGEMPQDVIGEGKKIVKKRFATVAIFYAATRIIKGIFSELGRGITRVGEMIGGNKGESVGNIISSVVQVIVAYLSDCCLGWVFYRSDENAAKATCEGAVLFFRHGKTFVKNMGRVFGMGLASLVVIGGAFTGLFYVIASFFPQTFQVLANEFAEIAAQEGSEIPALLTNPATLMLACAGVGGLVLWTILHNAFVRPLVLTGVLRNYLESGMNDVPTEASFAEVGKKSRKFAKLCGELN